MDDIKQKVAEARLESLVGNLLRAGVLMSALIIAVGGVVYLIRHGLSLPHYGVFHGEPSDLCSVLGILHNAIRGGGRGLMQLGLLVLIATPVVRVALLAIGFAWQRDRLYTAISLIVLTLLLYSLFSGRLS